jgi:hypothetical protein
MRFSRHQQLTASAAGPNRILLVTLQTEQEPVIPITADIVWQIFSSYGFIEKIVVMNRQSQEYAGAPSLPPSRPPLFYFILFYFIFK